MTDQVMHFHVKVRDSNKSLYAYFVYANNYHITRRQLWYSLKAHKQVIKDSPWFIMGDFNVALDAKDSTSGASWIPCGMEDFRNCVRHIEVEDTNSRASSTLGLKTLEVLKVSSKKLMVSLVIIMRSLTSSLLRSSFIHTGLQIMALRFSPFHLGFPVRTSLSNPLISLPIRRTSRVLLPPVSVPILMAMRCIRFPKT